MGIFLIHNPTTQCEVGNRAFNHTYCEAIIFLRYLQLSFFELVLLLRTQKGGDLLKSLWQRNLVRREVDTLSTEQR